ncbi:hypothetical protein AMTRI_Chr03g53040 [Amborella trichopoda]|uniref:uncharacterized protein LOC105420251 n=1 Tax=Amborella trichopoda TaxID=13333 RepID=UPI0005D3A971|nr:uncharacterized protein LOC105420251 [Amborella trichopoda]|eukprot:XP_011621534.1 uncharacterized protein LOC105420251 [Amborella trichopoda]
MEGATNSGQETVDMFEKPVFDMGSLRESLPRKRGLSKFFSGKSQSFASIGDVESVDDLSKGDDCDSPSSKRRKRNKYNVHHHHNIFPTQPLNQSLNGFVAELYTVSLPSFALSF